MPIELRPVRHEDYNDQWFLYILLRTRMLEPEFNISHLYMPSFDEHVAFVRDKPYEIWDIIVWPRKIPADIGASYVTRKHEVGIYLLPYYRGLGYGSHVLKHYQDAHPYLVANIAKSNMPSIAFFEWHGFMRLEEQPNQFVYVWSSANASTEHPVDRGERIDPRGPITTG